MTKWATIKVSFQNETRLNNIDLEFNSQKSITIEIKYCWIMIGAH